MKNRRQFLRESLALPLVLGNASLLGSLASFDTRAADTSGYRALVCVFLFGGMDCHDTVLPFDQASYDDYADVRSDLLAAYAAQPGGSSRARSALLPLSLPGDRFGGRQFALPPQMSALYTLFEQGRAAVVGNVGPLLEPVDRNAFLANNAAMPPRLFSHNDQQSTWMAFAPEGAQYGWGGRFGDVVNSANAESIFSQVSLSGNTVFLTGDSVSPYQISPAGVPAIRLIESAPPQFAGLLRDHFASTGAQRSNLFERDFIDISRVTLDANEILEAALQSGSGLSTGFPGSGLGQQLRAVAETIAVRDQLGAKRQVFFVAMGGFDTHSNQAADLPGLQQVVSDAIGAFYLATQELGVASDVTTFTAADFGRTLTVNGDGTDHGWGGHHFVVGGAVRGGDIYGDIPVSRLGHEQDAGNGRLIPTTSVQQFAAPLGRWFGLGEQELGAALPGLAAFGGTGPQFLQV